MLIVEGPDGAGKTTLIQALQHELGLPIAPRVVSKDAEAMVDLPAWVEMNLSEGFQHRIFDRHRLISEPVYGPILRHDQEAGFDDIETMQRWMFKFYNLQPIIIYCIPPLDTVLKNIAGDIENQVVWDHIRGIYSAYVARAAIDCRAGRNVFIYDYTQDNTHNLISIVKGILNRVI